MSDGEISRRIESNVLGDSLIPNIENSESPSHIKHGAFNSNWDDKDSFNTMNLVKKINADKQPGVFLDNQHSH
jgi:hypothetical protein